MNDGNQSGINSVPERDPSQQVHWFRHSAPYIHAYRGRTVVILLPGELLVDGRRTTTVVQDIALLNSLGIKLVIAFGAKPQIDERLEEAGLPLERHHGMRVTNAEALTCVAEAVGRLRMFLEARLSMGLASSPMHGASLQVSSGNFVVARPVGVVDGLDMCHTGLVRKVHAESIHKLLAMGHIVLLSNIGYSPTGELFNLSSEDVASSAAIALKADKLIAFGQEPGVLDTDARLLREISVEQALRQLEYTEKDSDERRKLFSVCRAVQNGVSRAHMISYQQDGALLQELFTRDGIGTLVTDESYDEIRPATIDDVGGILALIRPLEEQGVLVRRSRELLEREIGNFIVDDRDGSIIACAALYVFPEEGVSELACVAVKPNYSRQGRGDKLLAGAEKKALDMGMRELFVLTTQTAHWFIERGFRPASVSELPVAKQQMYNLQRNSKVFIKTLV